MAKKLTTITDKPTSIKIRLYSKRLAIVILSLCLCVLLFAPFIAVPLFVNQHITYRGYATEKYPLQDIYQANDYSLKEKQMYLTTEDGLKIWTSEIYTSKPKAVIIYLSGIAQPSITYFYGHAKLMQEHGFASILLEVRGHGKSDGARITLGYEELLDVKAVVTYIRSNASYDNVPIVLHGVSMGGAASINAFGQIKEIDGLIAMSAYSSFEDVVIDLLHSYRVPDFLLRLEKPLLSAALKLLYGKEAVENLTPLKQIKNTNERPVLLIACTGDTNVPVSSTLRLQEANPEAQIWLRDSWEHFIIKDCDFINVALDQEYCDKILSFLNNVVKK